MSIYGYLSTPIPTIAYTILHQAGPAVGAEEYAETMKELHARMSGESADVNTGYRKALQETMGREAQMLRGALSQFLETPIRSDNAEVQKIFLDAFERFREIVVAPPQYGTIASSEGRIVFPEYRRPQEKKLARSGKTYLSQLGFSIGKGGRPLHESVFYIQGGANLDVLEHLVRDRFGIYASTHGKHLAEFSKCLFAAYNLVSTLGLFPARTPVEENLEAVIWFDKPAVQYGEFRQGLSTVLDSLVREKSPSSLALWQRKLGLGRGREFALRLAAPSREGVEGLVEWLRECRKPEFVRDALMGEGALLTRELFK